MTRGLAADAEKAVLRTIPAEGAIFILLNIVASLVVDPGVYGAELAASNEYGRGRHTGGDCKTPEFIPGGRKSILIQTLCGSRHLISKPFSEHITADHPQSGLR
jgi:hypothetical protein